MLATEHWNPHFIVDAFTNAAHIAIAWDQPERAARLIGAGNALREAVGIGISMERDRVPIERVCAAARTALGEAAFASAVRAGKGLTLDEAIDEVE